MFQRHPIQTDELFFITTNTLHRRPVFAEKHHARIAIDTLYRTKNLHPFILYGFVFMPDHCHLLLQIDEGETLSRIMRVFKYGVSMNIGKGPVWQSRFFVKIPHDASVVLRYIHLNPVKENLSDSAEQYPWSSASGRWPVSDLAIL